ncbi:MAG: hypothetical protein Q6J44_07055 [Gloeomargarita sp. DG02_4_bins_56]
MLLMTHSPRQPTIVHGVPGRLRIRIPSLQTSPDLKMALEAKIKATPAVETVRISAPTDCIIVNYCPQQPIQDNLYQQICQITQAFLAPAVDSNHPHQPELRPAAPTENPPTPAAPVAGSADCVSDLAPEPSPDVPKPRSVLEETFTPPVGMDAPPPTAAKPPARRSRPSRKPRTRKKPEPPASP